MTPLAHCHLFTSGFYSERRIWFNEVIGQESVCSTGRCVSFLEKPWASSWSEVPNRG